jgi:hypothetical protein
MAQHEFEPVCELCEAARMTDWFHEDEICWVAECEACWVPMVVWREHGIDPPESAREHMLRCLDEAVRAHYTFEPRIDDNMRTIPNHFHVHARPRSGFSGHGMRRT